jgi:hypothetical protein
MKKRELDHVLRAAGRITGERLFVIIGSQALHGQYPDLADEIIRSAEVDLLAAKNSKRTEWLNAIGVYSQFHETFGYYADPVDEKTATLPKGWKGRLVPLPPGETEGVKGLCLEAHDLAIAKYVASPDKDLVFTRELARRGLLSEERLLLLLNQTPVDESVRVRIRNQVTCDLHAHRDLDSVREAQTTDSQQPTTNTGDDLEAIKARGRAEWLKRRRRAGLPSPTSGTSQRHSSKSIESNRNTSESADDDESL